MGRLGTGAWWAALLLAYGVGAFANHCLYVVIHDATHKLIFKNRAANYLVAIIGDLPNLIPGAIGFSICHLAHHARQGLHSADADLAGHWEARLIGNRWYGKALWLLVFPLFQLTRPIRLKNVLGHQWLEHGQPGRLRPFDMAMVHVFGWNAILYLAGSMLFSIGLHPLGSRWIQEHFTLDPVQETGSYYGMLNRLALNVGYHNEHHDFPSVPWNRLPAHPPASRRNFMTALTPAASWSRLWLTFICRSRYSLYSRVLRAEINRSTWLSKDAPCASRWSPVPTIIFADGVALTLNRLVGYLERQGVEVLVFTPTADKPAFAHQRHHRAGAVHAAARPPGISPGAAHARRCETASCWISARHHPHRGAGPAGTCRAGAGQCARHSGGGDLSHPLRDLSAALLVPGAVRGPV